MFHVKQRGLQEAAPRTAIRDRLLLAQQPRPSLVMQRPAIVAALLLSTAEPAGQLRPALYGHRFGILRLFPVRAIIELV